MTPDEVWYVTHTERAALATMLAELTAEEWQRPSLCEGWSVRDVAAHVIVSPQARPKMLMLAFAHGRGDFDRANTWITKRMSARPIIAILADYDHYADSHRHPLGTSIVDPMVDVLVHTQDIAIPLSRRRDMPLEAARVAAQRVWDRFFPFRAQPRLRGARLVASDIDWAVGSGPRIEGPIEPLLLLLTGRTAAVGRLHGPGLRQLNLGRK